MLSHNVHHTWEVRIARAQGAETSWAEDHYVILSFATNSRVVTFPLNAHATLRASNCFSRHPLVTARAVTPGLHQAAAATIAVLVGSWGGSQSLIKRGTQATADFDIVYVFAVLDANVLRRLSNDDHGRRLEIRR